MFDFDMTVTVGDETCSSLTCGDVMYTLSTCNGNVACTAHTQGATRVSYQLINGKSADVVFTDTNGV